MKPVRDHSDLLGDVPSDHEEKRLQALRNGYCPIPANGKVPALPNWVKVDPTPDDIMAWSTTKSATNTGLVCRGIVAVDIDVKVPVVAAKLLQMALRLVNDGTPLVRFGRRPKVLLVLRSEEEMHKMQTPRYADPLTGAEHQVEILARGQQFIADGTHPEGMIYEYEGATPFDTPRNELPEISAEQCAAFLREAEEVFKQEDWELTKREAPKKQHAARKPPANDNRRSERIASPFQLINSAALRNLHAWVPDIFPQAEWQPGTGAWRVSSQSLGRQLEEDLSLHPEGIRDHGEEISMSAIDVVLKFGNAASVDEAADWLCEKMGFDPKQKLLQLMNACHAVVRMNGKVVVLNDERKEITFGSVNDLKQFYANVRVLHGTKFRSIADVWMQSGTRRTYDRVTFAPQGTDSRSYNLWRGPSVKADPDGSCRLFLDHLLNIVCKGHQERFGWLIKWLAHTVQKPQDKPGTAVVLQGVKGCGKDTVGEYFGKIFEHHYTKISKPEHLHGRFNAHQAETLFLHVEEGFWAGDKAAEGTLKHLITSPVVLLEKKGVDAFLVDSYLRVFVSSNEDWVVPVSANGERRFFVLKCSDAVARNEAYFDPLYHEMENGGRLALLAHLQAIDLTGFNVRTPPVTDALVRQAIESLKNIELWWYDILWEGNEGSSLDWSEDMVASDCGEVYQKYAAWMKERRFDGQALTAAKFGQKLREIAPVERTRPRSPRGYRSSRPYQYSFPSLEVCRAHFDQRLGHPIEWPQD